MLAAICGLNFAGGRTNELMSDFNRPQEAIMFGKTVGRVCLVSD